MIKLKNYINKSQELKNNIIPSSYKCKEDGNNKENNGNNLNNKIEENMNNFNKNLDSNKDNGKPNKNISKDKSIKCNDKIKNYNSSSNKWKLMHKDSISTLNSLMTPLNVNIKKIK